MKTVASVLILLFLALAMNAQNARKTIFWSGDSGCGFKSRSVSKEDRVACSSLVTHRGPVSTISLNGIGLAVAFLEEDRYIIVAARIINQTPDVILFDSDLWGAAHFKARGSFYAGEKPISAETSMPSRDIIRLMSSATKLDNSLGEFMAETTLTNETREVRRSDGTRQRITVFVPDKAVKDAEARQTVNRAERLTADQVRIRNTALTVKSVPAAGSVDGLVYFRRFSKAQFVVFSLAVGDAVFVFQLPRSHK